MKTKFLLQRYEISETTYPIGLKFSGIVVRVNRIAVLKFQSLLINLRKNDKTGNSGKISP